MKRTLALVLALVMAIGLMAFPVSADFTDDAEIKYAEAVDVMSAIGVINGFEDGSFDPDGYLTREQAAKVVAYLMLGAEQADALGATSAPFDDVAANRWSAGYIAYCVNEGIINGRSETTFDPTGNVTGYEFAKLMLGCLGYSSSIEKYTGAQWNINVAKTALTIGLFDGNKGANYNVALTREEAALYAFNMIQADLVDYDNRGTEIDLGNGMSLVTGASKAEPIQGSGFDTIDSSNNYIQFAERYFEDLEKEAGEPDDFQRPSTKWTYDKDTVGTYSDEADFTYTVGTEGKSIYSDLSKPDSDTVYNYYVDGKPVSTIGNYYDGFAIASGNEKKIGGNGTVVEIYDVTKDDDDHDTYDVVVINTYAATIANWTEADEDKDIDEYITIAPKSTPMDQADGIAAFTLDEDFETVQFSEDDADDETVVYYTAAYDDDETYVIKSVTAADSVTAFISKTTGESSFVAGGETYKYNKTIDKYAEYVKDADDAVIYFDSYGYVIYIDTDATASDDFAFVLDTTYEESWGTETYYAKLVLESGEVVVAEVDDDAASYSNFENKFANKVVTYDVDKDGVYELNLDTGVNKFGLSSPAFTLDKGVSELKFPNDSPSNFYTNSKTVFVIASYDAGDKVDDYDFNVYTGIANVPSINGIDGLVTDARGGEVAKFVYIQNADSAATSEDIVFVANDTHEVISSADYDDYYVLNAIVNNEVVELMIKDGSDADDKLTGSPDPAYIVYTSLKYDSDGLVIDFTGGILAPAASANETKKVENDVVEVNGKYFSLADDCAVFTVDDGDITSGSVSSIRNSSSMSINVYTNDDGFVSTVILFK